MCYFLSNMLLCGCWCILFHKISHRAFVQITFKCKWSFLHSGVCFFFSVPVCIIFGWFCNKSYLIQIKMTNYNISYLMNYSIHCLRFFGFVCVFFFRTMLIVLRLSFVAVVFFFFSFVSINILFCCIFFVCQPDFISARLFAFFS